MPAIEGLATIDIPALGGIEPDVTWTDHGAGLFHARVRFALPDEVAQDDFQIVARPAFEPTFHWAPHLTPTADHIVDQHSFRAPALIMADAERVLTLMPDVALIRAHRASSNRASSNRASSNRASSNRARWYVDLDAPDQRMVMGLSRYDTKEHVLFVRKPGARYPAGTLELGFYVLASREVDNPWRQVLALYWQAFGAKAFASGLPLPGDLSPYVKHTYRWAFDTWENAVWQQFELDGKQVGAPVFIVNQTQSPNYPGQVNEREFRSVWNQAWFSSLRSASGVFRHARRVGDDRLRERALMTKELALATPQRDGIFPSVIATEMEKVTIDGKTYRRSRGWDTAFWGNSDRNPISRPAGGPRNDDVRIAPYHVLDMSWTALLMLRWHSDLDKDQRLVDYATRYADALLKLQREDGFFPAWLDAKTGQPLALLSESPETSMSVTFLLKLAAVTGDTRYRQAALRAMDAVAARIIPVGRWEDFETYWSCSPWGVADQVGTKVARNNMFKQNNFSMFWTAEALYHAHLATTSARYLSLGQRTLDELLMTQASWQPPYMYVNVFGGFGVMNGDAEWLDSRASLFAELIIRYGQLLGVDEYIQRGLAAMRSSFVMMYCPENPKTRAQWEKKYPFFGEEDFGFTMENYGHGGHTGPDATGVGVFTIYDWGNGAASEAYNRLLDHFGRDLVTRTH